MTRAHQALAAGVVLALSACFHPEYDRPACGPGDSCPGGFSCVAGFCEKTGEQMPVPDAAVGCLQHWMDDTVSVSEVRELTGLRSASADRNPWISADGLRLYFQRDVDTTVHNEIYLARRQSTSEDFAAADAVANVNTVADELRPALTVDEDTLVFSSNRAPGGKFEIYLVTASIAGQFGAPVEGDARVAMVNAGASNKFDPFLGADGRELYLSPSTATGQTIARATRTTSGGEFGTPVLVTELDGLAVTADPAQSLDGRIIVFSAAAAAQQVDLYYATRATASGEFGAPQKIPMVNSDIANDTDPMLSADGCELYFASTRDSDRFQLFRAAIGK